MAENMQEQLDDGAAVYRVQWIPLAICTAGFAAFEVALVYANGQFVWFPVIAVVAAVVMFVVLRVLGARYNAERPWFGGKKTANILLRSLGFIFFLAAFVLGIIMATWMRNGLLVAGMPIVLAIVIAWVVLVVLALIYYRLIEAIMNLLAAVTNKPG